MNRTKDQYLLAYQYWRLLKYRDETQTTSDYPAFSPCTGCDSDCQYYDECWDNANEHESIYRQVVEDCNRKLALIEPLILPTFRQLAHTSFKHRDDAPQKSILVKTAQHWQYCHHYSSRGIGIKRDVYRHYTSWEGYRTKREWNLFKRDFCKFKNLFISRIAFQLRPGDSEINRHINQAIYNYRALEASNG